MLVTPAGWDMAVRPDDVTQRVLGAVSFIRRSFGVNAGETALDSSLLTLTERHRAVLVTYLELHFGVQVPMDAAQSWVTVADVVQTVRTLAPREMLEVKGLEIDLQDVLVAVSTDRQHYITPFVPIQNIFGKLPAPCDGRVVVVELTPDRIVGTTVSAAGINQVVTDVDASSDWRYLQVTVLLVYRPGAGQPIHRLLSGRNWAVSTAAHALQFTAHIEPGTCLVDQLPNL